MKKIIFITPTDNIGASARYRVYQYLEYLPNEILYTVYPFMSNNDYFNFKKNKKLRIFIKMPLLLLKRCKLILKCKKNDIIFLHRDIIPFGPIFFERILKLKGCKIILDLDDAVYSKNIDEISSGNKLLYKLKYGKRFDSLIKIVDSVLCGNKYIYEHCIQYNKKCTILPTVIDTEKVKVRNVNMKKNGEITIAWIGNPGNSNYVLAILDQINEYFKNSTIKCNLKLIGAKNINKKYSHINIIQKQWNLCTEYEELYECDFGIMPLLDTEWSKGKCGAKILQYFASGMPALASNVGVNNEIIDDGINGFVVKDNNWYEGIDKMVKKYTDLDKMGKNGRKKVEDKYSINANLHVFLNEIECKG